MSEHTPGPWEAHDRIANGAGILVTDTSGSLGICRVICPQRSSDETPDAAKMDADICRANARLIAAAPEMLAELTWFVDRAALTHDYSHEGCESCAHVRFAREMLAKAKGKTHGT